MTNYLIPTTVEIPGLTLTQFIQTVIVGVSGLPGESVRPKWQRDPLKNPGVEVNWIALGIENVIPDANAYVGVDVNGNNVTQRHEALEVGLDIYGPNALALSGLIRDGFQIPENRYQLFANNLGFTSVSNQRAVPDLVNERFVKRYVMTVYLRREVQRVYQIPTILSAAGTIYTVVGNEEYLLPFSS